MQFYFIKHSLSNALAKTYMYVHIKYKNLIFYAILRLRYYFILKCEIINVYICSGVSHSAMSDMTTIEQEGATPTRAHLDDIDDFTATFTMIR